MTVIPSCMFPTTVVFVDDDPGFLRHIAAELSSRVTSYKFCTNPIAALDFLNKEYKPDPFTNRCMDRPEEERFEHHSMNVNIRLLHQEIYNPKRFDQISTVVIDHDMPGMNGLELCEKITDPNIQKILLTGVANESVVIDAFNKQIIQGFIRKQDNQVFDLVSQAISEAQRTYFNTLSKPILEILVNNPNIPPTALNEPGFNDIFQKILEENKTVEYYLFESSGCFLFLDKHGNDSALFTYPEDLLNIHCEIAESHLDEHPENKKEVLSFIGDIQKRKKIFCYHKRDNIMWPKITEWKSYLHPATKFSGNSNYFYAYEPKLLDIDRGGLLSFSTYQDGQSLEVA
ncbi:MAG: hypothetical protein HON43_04675 [Alphaproteobacteria bacterium]|jgi:CheY-like chemotaxis protein|nr:hypothetical protein [Alphaproteobacteria bacterium]MBT5390188.1 hypothetical protein [Alphaproteobacteria bacterium]